MAEEYEQLCVAALQSYLQAHLPTYLRAIETADSLAANSLTDPVDYVRASVPSDPRFPLIQIYDVKTLPAFAGHRNFIAKVEVEVIVSDVVAGTDLQAGEDKVRRYLRAVRNAIAADYQIGTASTPMGKVTSAVWTESGRVLHETFSAGTRVGRGLLFECEVYDSR